MSQQLPARPPISTPRALGLPLLLGWCALLFLGSLPKEITPGPLMGLTERVQAAFDAINVRAGSFVFSGNRGDHKRRFFGIRVLAWHPDGTSTVIHESPPNLHYSTVRFSVPMRDTISFKMLDFATVSTLLSSEKPENRAKRINALRTDGRSLRVARFFCHSKEFSSGDPRNRVSIELYSASVSYAKGALSSHRDTVVYADCKADRLILYGLPEPTARPEWPGVHWE